MFIFKITVPGPAVLMITPFDQAAWLEVDLVSSLSFAVVRRALTFCIQVHHCERGAVYPPQNVVSGVEF